MTRFPDCEIIRIPQHLEDGTENPEWLEFRKGYLTASVFGAWLVEKPEVRLTVDQIKEELDRLNIPYPKTGKKEVYVSLLPDPDKYATLTEKSRNAREDALYRVVAEAADLWQPEQRWTNDEVIRGNRLEPQAIADFERATGKKVESVGFCRSKFGRFGCSPDGLILGENGGLECKVPTPQKHMRRRNEGVLPEEHKLQVHGCIAVTGAEFWEYQSWNPNLASLRVRVERDQFTEDLLAGLKLFANDVEKVLQREAEAWEAEFGKEAA